jgi:hypothetical protein
MRTTASALAVVVLFALAALAVSVLRHPQYHADGIVYARYAARDAGYSERDATLAARRFYERTPLMAIPRYRSLIEIDPSVSFARSRIFENRVLYPWVVSFLLPVLGFRALFIVSAISYVAFGMALFWLLRPFGRPWLAAAITIVALALPLTRTLASSDLTDMFAAIWWTIALAALLRSMRDRRASILWILAIASVLLTLTRPTPYLIVVPALFVAALRGTWMPLVAACSSIVIFAILAVTTHAYGLSEQLHWIFTNEPRSTGNSFAGWYRAALSSTVVFTVITAFRMVLPILLIVAALYGAARTRMRDELIVLLAAALACLISIPFNPVPSAVLRVVGFPLVPVFCAIAQCFVCGIADSRTALPQAQRAGRPKFGRA